MKRTDRAGAVLASALLLATGGLLSAAGDAAAGGPPSRAVPAHAARTQVAACTYSQLIPDGAQRVGADRLRITVVNEGPKPCTLRGFPTVAVAGLGSPEKNKPLTVGHQGDARLVQLMVGGRAATQITFTPVLGEAEGYCASGATPTVAPSIVLGVAGGKLQLGLEDGGDVALCGTTVRATAFRGSPA
ncbi:hypothetical protein GCM10020367_60890 [Streptomyces sannanensis]|uniref:DUF4232 domain-containing protein n=1 Tax=Streptomyces sannanensis TaxID=285536 RepID=A0ABP6SKQ5_9ACTN